MTIFHGTKHNDTFDESSDTSSDTFDLFKGGEDTAIGGSGDDRFNMGASFDAGDRLDGGAGHDVVFLHGDYSAGVVLQDLTIQNIEAIRLGAGFDYNLTLANGNVANDAILSVDGSNLGAGNSMIIDASAVTAGHVWMTGGAGDDDLTGGAKGDRFHLELGGNDAVHAGGGADTIFMGGALTAADQIDGGAGNDTVALSGGDDIVLGANTLTSVETLTLSGGSFDIATNDGNVASGATLTVDATALTTAQALSFDGSAERDGSFVFEFGANFTTNDVITGGAGNDTLSFNGTYSSLAIASTNVTGIETLTFLGGNSYSGVTVTGDIAGGSTLTIDASAAGSLSIDLSGVTSTGYEVIGSAGNDTITGSSHVGGIFHLEAGGNDTFTGGAGVDDTFYMGASLTVADRIDGGTGGAFGAGSHNKVILDGDYSGGLVLGATTLTNIEILQFTAGHSYNITLNAATLTAYSNTFDGSALGAGDSLVIDGSAMATRTGTEFIGGAGNDVITANGGATIDISLGGDDTVHCASRDGVLAGAALTAADTIFGAGNTSLILDGDYSAGITLSNVTNISSIGLGHTHSYNITLAAGTATGGRGLTLSSDGPDSGTLIVDGSLSANNISFAADFGNRTLTGGSGSDFFEGLGSGTNILHGGGGNDAFKLFGQSIGGDDVIDGGTGNDTLELDGNYSGGLAISDANVNSIETIQFDGLDGGPYNITITGDISGSAALSLDGSLTNTHTPLTLDLTAATSASYVITGSPADDTIKFAGNFSASDSITCGGGNDTLELNGDYSLGITFGAATITGIDDITLADGHTYAFTENNGNVVSGATLTVDASALTGSNQLFFFGSAESDGHYAFIGGAGADDLEGGAQSDTFDLSRSDGAFALGNGGNDTFTVTLAAKLADDFIDGGSGSDTLVLNGDFSTQTTITASNVENIETLQLLGAANSYDLSAGDGITGAGTLTVDASAAANLNFDASGTTATAYVITGSAGADTITGGAKADTITGGAGADTLTGGGGADTFNYVAASDSNTSTGYDTIADLTTADSIHIAELTPSFFGTETVNAYQGSLDADLASVLSGMTSGAYAVVTLSGASDPLSGHTFLVVDGNGTAGYTAGADYVIDITGYSGDPSQIHFI